MGNHSLYVTAFITDHYLLVNISSPTTAYLLDQDERDGETICSRHNYMDILRISPSDHTKNVNIKSGNTDTRQQSNENKTNKVDG